MKKALIIAIIVVFATSVAIAQEAYDVKETWQKTITVPASQASTIEKLFTAWGQEFPGAYVNAFNKFKKTGKADKIEIFEGVEMDFNVDFAPKDGYLEINGVQVFSFTDGDYTEEIERAHILQAVYWSLPNGNKLFGVSIKDDGEVFPECALALYEYDAAKGTLTPRPKIVQKVMDVINDDEDTFLMLPKEGRDLHYIDYLDDGKLKTIKWTGNGF